MQKNVNTSDKNQAFKEEVKELCKKYNISISHEDFQGGFILINSYDEEFMKWFMDATASDKFPRQI